MKTLGFILAIAVSPFALSGEIVANKGIEILAVDGVKIPGGLFSSDEVEVDDGSHQIVAKYMNTFEKNELVESRPYIFTIEVKGQTQLNTNKFNTQSQAAAKIDNGLDWFVINKDGEYTVKETAQLTGKGFMPYSDIEGLIAEYNQANKIMPTGMAATAYDNTSSEINLIVEQYKAATKEQKKQFNLWFIENLNKD